MALSASINRRISYTNMMITRNMTVATGKEVFEGSIVEITTSYIQPATGSGLCMGVAAEHGDAGDEIRVQYNHVEVFTIASPLESKNGSIVYATADDTITYSSGTTIVGKQVGLVPGSATQIYVQVCLDN